MPIGPDQQRLNPEERANLVAYIDGELTELEARALATKLTHSVTGRREVETLKQTWEFLEYLPKPRASDQFSERTLTQVRTLELRGQSWDASMHATVLTGAKMVVCAIVAAASMGLGFVATRWVWPDSNARMARDLSLAEHLDEYLDVGSLEFLDELVRSREFGSPTP